jgi:N-dimethylarginine dimethylaminohydrolase
MGLRLRYLPKEEGLYFEGTGDCKWSHNFKHLWISYGVGRTTLKGISAVKSIIKEELGEKTPKIHSIRLLDPITFHIDLALLPLPNNRVLYYPTISPSSVKELETVFGAKNMIKVPRKFFYACNSVILHDGTLLVPRLPYDDFRQWMYKATQMKLDEVNLNQFHLGNGSVQCMCLNTFKI